MLSANQAAISQETDNCNTNINLAYLLPFYMFPITIAGEIFIINLFDFIGMKSIFRCKMLFIV